MPQFSLIILIIRNSECPTRLIYRKRIFPSGCPIEKITTLVQSNLTSELEYEYFKCLVKTRKILSLKKDIWIYDQLKRLTHAAVEKDDLCTV